MTDDIVSFAASLILLAGLVGLMWLSFNWRRAFAVRRRIVIKASLADVWRAIDPSAGALPWRSHIDRIEPLGTAGGEWRFHWRIDRRDGDAVTWSSDFAEDARDDRRCLALRRSGIEGQPLHDKLLRIEAGLTPAGDGTEVRWRERWGPRSLAGIYSSHVDAAAQLSRLKSFCETGTVATKRASVRSATISVLSALATIAAFSLLLGPGVAALLVFVLLVHELGHLVSFRMVGQPWGRIMFVPFVGAVSVSRIPHRRLADDVFCALMGAGFSLVLLVPALWFALAGIGVEEAIRISGLPLLAYVCAVLTAGLNLLNLLPIFPLDGGRYLRAVVQSLAPSRVGAVMLSVAGLFAIAAIAMHNILLLALAAIAFFQGRRLGPPRAGVALMSRASLASMSAAYAALLALHGGSLYAWMGVFMA